MAAYGSVRAEVSCSVVVVTVAVASFHALNHCLVEMVRPSSCRLRPVPPALGFGDHPAMTLGRVTVDVLLMAMELVTRSTLLRKRLDIK